MREVNPYIKSRRERETKAFYRAIAGFVPIMIAAVVMSLAFPSPDYKTSKEFLRIFLDVNGILFGIGGIFATFLLKNAYDVRENFNKRYENSGKHHVLTQWREMRWIIANVIKLIGMFFILAILSIFYSLFGLLKTNITSGDLGLCFGLILASFYILYYTFDYQTREIEALQYIIHFEGFFHGVTE